MAYFMLSPTLKGKKTTPFKLSHSLLRCLLGVLFLSFSHFAFATDIGGRIFCDKDGDNVYDSGEGLSGVTVKVYRQSNNTLLGSPVTNSSGTYTMTANSLSGVSVRAEVVYNGITYYSTGTAYTSALNVQVTCAASCDCPDNALINGSFEDEVTGWTASGGNFYNGTGYQICGAKNAYLEATTSNARFYQNVNVTPGSAVSLSFWAGTHEPSLSHFVRLKFYTSADVVIGGSTVEVEINKDVDSGPYPRTQYYTLNANAPANASYVQVEGTATGDYIKIDMACLKITCPTVTDANPIDTKTICSGTNVTFSAKTTALSPVTLEWVRFDASVANPYTATGNGKTSLGASAISSGSASKTSNNFPAVNGQVKSYYVYALLKGATSTCQPFVSYKVDVIKPSVSATGGIVNCAAPSRQITAVGSITPTAGTTTAYSWAGPAGATFTPNNTVANPTVSAAGTYTVTYSVTKAGVTCSATDTAKVTSYTSTPNADAGTNKVVTCTTTSVQLNGSSSTAGVTYKWTGPAGATFTPSSTSAVPTVSVAGTYMLTVTGTNGCTATDVVEVTENKTPPNVNAGLDKVLNCVATSIQLNGSSSTAGATFSWSGPGGATFTPNNTSATPAVSVVGQYILTVTNPANGCTAKDTVVVTENKTQPTVVITGGELTCSTLNLAINANASAGVTYAWSGTGINGQTSQNVSVSSEGIYTVTVTNTVSKCTATDTAVVTKDVARPTVAATGGAITCTNSSVSINAQAAPPGVTFAWTGPGNFTATTPSITATLVGVYTVTVVNPDNNCTASDTAIVIENKVKPTVNASADKVLTCAQTSIQLSGSSSTAGAAFSWVGPVGAVFTPNVTSATPTVTVAGTYILTVTNPGNGCIAKDTVIVTEDKSKPTVTIDDAVLTCLKTSLVLTANGSTGVTYLWTGANANGKTTKTVTVSAAGTYSVVVTKTANGCTVSDTAVVTEDKQKPTVSLNPITLTCASPSQTLTAAVTDAGANPVYAWTVPQGVTAPGNVKSFAVTKEGVYTVVVTNSAGGCFEDASVTVEADTAKVLISLTPITLTCASPSHVLKASVINGGADPTYVWTVPQGVTGPGNIDSLVVTKAGVYSVEVTNSLNGCKDNASVTVTADTAKVSVTLNPITLTCQSPGQIMTATVTKGGVSPIYVWTVPQGATSPGNSATATVTLPGLYTVEVTNALNGCKATASETVKSDTNRVTVTLNSVNITCAAPSQTLTATVKNGGANPVYVWTVPQGVTNPGNVASFAISVGGTYTVQVTNALNGCKGSAFVTVAADTSKPILEISERSCAIDLQFYSVKVVSNGTVTAVPYTVTANGGGVFTVSDIPAGQSVLITATSATTQCKTTLQVAAPDCSCPPINPPIGTSQTYCEGDTSAALTVVVGAGETADWYSAATGGTLLASGTLSFKPATPGTYYPEARKIDGPTCSSSRIALTLTIDPKPTLAISQAPKCAANVQSYSFTVISNGTVTSTLGQVVDNQNGSFTVSNVPVNQDALVTATSDKTCKAELTIKASDCSCPPSKCVPYTVVIKKK
ncbi:hypothetical protein [Runella sp.]|uniref:beta strand repeat-containing protein n=1 Tax=Runella sp. TaxID=1960881 RepID=UPI003D0AAFD5